MNIKHFVITRFLSWTGMSGKDGFGEKLFSSETKEYAYNLIKNFFIPTLNNQTLQNFEIIFVTHNKFDVNEFYQVFNTFGIKAKYHILHNNEYESFIKNSVEGYDWLITTRLDYDDCVKNTAVEEVQKLLNNTSLPIFVYGYEFGYAYDINTGVLYKHNPKRKLKSRGFWSIFLSLCVNLQECSNIYNVYELHNHCNIVDDLFNMITDVHADDINKYIIHYNNELMPYVWIRHTNSGSNFLKYTQEYERIIELTDDAKQDFLKTYALNI